MKVHIVLILPFLVGCESNIDPLPEPCGNTIIEKTNINIFCFQNKYNMGKDYSRESNNLEKILMGGHTSPNNSSNNSLIYKETNSLYNFKNNIFNFSKNNKSNLEFSGKNFFIKSIIIKKLMLLTLGDGSYYAPDYKTGGQTNTYPSEKGFINSLIYNPDNENIALYNSKIESNYVNISQWNANIYNNTFIIDKSLKILGSISNFKNNVFYKNSYFQNKSYENIITRINYSTTNDIISINNNNMIIHIKFSPDTVIDSNTFTLTQKNDQIYAIVLDHSPRVRITNNTFNGFKVPILMDQWSSIVDEKGNEIKPEDFTGYGNVINPDKFAGNVTMNRKGEIVRE